MHEGDPRVDQSAAGRILPSVVDQLIIQFELQPLPQVMDIVVAVILI